MILGGALVLPACGGTSSAADDSGLSPNQQARQLLDAVWKASAERDIEKVGELLSPEYQLLRTDGSSETRASYLDELRKSADQYEIASYEISDIEAKRDLDAGIITATCTIATDLIVDGKRFTKDPVPFLETFIWQEDEWRLASEGNFGRPE